MSFIKLEPFWKLIKQEALIFISACLERFMTTDSCREKIIEIRNLEEEDYFVVLDGSWFAVKNDTTYEEMWNFYR